MKRAVVLLLLLCLSACSKHPPKISQPTVAAPTPAPPNKVEIPPAATPPSGKPADDRYQFAAGFSVEHQVTLSRMPDGVQFVWPQAVTDWDTALLQVRSWGAEAQPWVEISAGQGQVAEYIDPNALGLRWLNVSSLRQEASAGTDVEIRTHGITIEPGSATLRLFSNQLDLRKSILILAPHPDDAEIAAFGLYADRNATIVTVTAGNAGDMNYRANVSDPPEHYLVKGYLRAVDSVTVPWQGRIPPDRAVNLGYFDARLATMHRNPDQIVPELYGPNDDVGPYRRANINENLVSGASRKNMWNNLVEDLSNLIRKIRPELVVMPHPWLDSHLDHEYSSVAFVQALEQSDQLKNATFLLYTNHADANHYPYGPADTIVSLPPYSASDLIVQRMFSSPVDSVTQRRKLFALESMHDLRLSPEEQSTCDQPNLLKRPDYPRVASVDYFRRAPRPNELFFVYNLDGVRQVIHSFLERPEAADDGK